MTEQQAFCDRLAAVCRRCDTAALLTPERAAAFYELYTFLVAENQKYNLTAVTSVEGVILLHFVDSLTVSAQIPAGAEVIDIGCGAGFPSLPLALCRPDLRIRAVDATAKKVGFVNAAAERLGLTNLEATAGRAEVMARGAFRDAFNVAIARAVAALPVLTELCAPFVKPGGCFLAMKGPDGLNERDAAKHAVGELKCKVSLTKEYIIADDVEEQRRTLLQFTKTAPTPEAYPRAYARILSRPL